VAAARPAARRSEAERATAAVPNKRADPAGRLAGAGIYVRLFARLIKFEHTIFALPFAYAGAFLAEARIPGFWAMLWITVAMVGARSLAMALNRLLDARIDALNPRTEGREIPSGRLSRAEVWVFAVLSLSVLVLATFQLPAITRYLWPLVVAPFVIYPFTKRWTWLCHLVLGATIGLGPVGAWVAVTGQVTWQPFLLGGAVALWIAGFDVIYACMDIEFDREHGIHSIPADFGLGAALWATRLCHLASLGLLAALGVVLARGPVFLVGVAVCGILLFYENWILRTRDLTKVDFAFQTMNSVVSVVFFVFTTVSVLVE
jgi:4-hydroxybenzoate polyprenyltransferase